MNYQKAKKKSKFSRISQELEEELVELDQYHPEAGADVRWAVISLLRAIKILS